MILAQLVCAAFVGVASPCLSQQDGVSIQGRVVDSSGKPIANAQVQIWRKPQREGKPFENEQVRIDASESLRTDADGRFVTPDAPGLEPDQPIRVIVQADGMLAARSPWVKPGDEKIVELGDLVLRRLRTVTGRVVDRHGRPVSDATVFHAGDAHKSERTTTDADGRFQLTGVPEGRAFLFVEKAEFRFTGKLIEPSQQDTELAVARSDEAVEPLKTLPPVLPRERELALARAVLDPWLTAVKESKRDQDKFWGLSMLAEVDPFEAYSMLDRVGFSPETDRKEYTRGGVIRRMIGRAKDPAEFQEIATYIESCEDRNEAAACYRWGAKQMPASDRAGKLDWLGRAVLNARSLKDPAKRAEWLAATADDYFGLGEKEQATRIADDAKAIVAELSDEDRNVLQSCAKSLVRVDRVAALKVLERCNLENWYGFLAGDLATKLAAQDPAESERIWNLAAKRDLPDSIAPAARDFGSIMPVCYRMAPVDMERTRRIAHSATDPVWKAYGLIAAAYALMKKQPTTSRELAVEALACLSPPNEKTLSTVGYWFHPSTVVTWTIPVLEQVAPELTRETLWRAVSYRESLPTVEWLDDQAELANCSLAMMIARYDRAVARVILEGVISRCPPPAFPVVGDDVGSMLVRAATLVDPEWAVSLIERLPEPPEARITHAKNNARLQVAVMLGPAGNERWTNAGYRDPAWPDGDD